MSSQKRAYGSADCAAKTDPYRMPELLAGSREVMMVVVVRRGRRRRHRGRRGHRGHRMMRTMRAMRAAREMRVMRAVRSRREVRAGGKVRTKVYVHNQFTPCID